jgi:hypothetical protein
VVAGVVRLQPRRDSDEGQPYQPLLTSRADPFWEASETTPVGARRHLLAAMVSQTPGFEPETLIQRLAGVAGSNVSEAARTLAASANRSELDLEPLLEFWRAALDADLDPSQYEGFGAFSLVDRVPDDAWLELTEQTAIRCDGAIDFPDRTARRAARTPDDVRSMRLVTRLFSPDMEMWNQYEVGQAGLARLRTRAQEASLLASHHTEDVRQPDR